MTIEIIAGLIAVLLPAASFATGYLLGRRREKEEQAQAARIEDEEDLGMHFVNISVFNQILFDLPFKESPTATYRYEPSLKILE